MNVTSQPLVSIVTPVYNEEEHLAECIESVLAQSYQRWDYTIVDNCSTDRSLEIARRYAGKDPRIRIHENERFLNMLANHNVAVRQISPASRYCKVVLGDDWIFPECLERMVAVGEACPSAGVVSAYQLHGHQVRSTGLPYEKRLVSGREVCGQFLLQTLVLFGTQTSVLYRADLVRSRNPFYIETDMCADWEACFALLKTSDLGFVHQVLTFSRPRPRSIGTIAWDMGANFGSLLGILFRYGRDCLTEEQFEECLELQLSQYYRFLGRRLWVERDRDFWSYHTRTLTKVGIRFSRARLAKAAVGQLCGALLDPKATAERVRRLFLLKKIRSWQTRTMALEVEARPSFGTGRGEDGDQPLAPQPSQQ
jgi:glycosyltransferase involved in cell wall biosynthesis